MICSKHQNKKKEELIVITSVDKYYDVQETFIVKIDHCGDVTEVNQKELVQSLKTEIEEAIDKFGDNLSYTEIGDQEVKTKTLKFLKDKKQTAPEYYLRKFLSIKYENEDNQEDQLLITLDTQTNRVILVANHYGKNEDIVICEYQREQEKVF